MQIEMGKFDVPGLNNKKGYAQAFKEFTQSEEPMMKLSFKTAKEAASCTNVLRALTHVHPEYSKYSVLRRKTEVYVLRED